jgi:hypothetical protein
LYRIIRNHFFIRFIQSNVGFLFLSDKQNIVFASIEHRQPDRARAGRQQEASLSNDPDGTAALPVGDARQWRDP